MRYQQVFGNTRFLAAAPQGMLISDIAFAYGPITFGSRQPRFQLDLSTTSKTPDGLSTVFSENVGSDDAVLFGPGSILWPNAQDDSGFIYRITFEHPFAYYPSQGNLLLDVRNFQAEQNCDFDLAHNCAMGFLGANVSGDAVSEVFANDVNALIGTTDTRGISAKFIFTAIPEPSTFALGLLGLAIFGACNWIKRGGTR
jgi:hypothetical protein